MKVLVENSVIKLLDQNYLKLQVNGLNDVLKQNIELKFKNALNVIFKFHSDNKKILFVGTPLQLTKQLKNLLKNTNHLIIPEKIWFNGILTNTKIIFKFLFKKLLKKNKNTLKFLFNLTIRNDLIVILNEYLSVAFLKEISKKQLPIISLNYNNVDLKKLNSTYKIQQNNYKNNNKFFFSILINILKKAEKFRKIKIYLKKKLLKKKIYLKKKLLKKKINQKKTSNKRFYKKRF